MVDIYDEKKNIKVHGGMPANELCKGMQIFMLISDTHQYSLD